ncbi:MAG: PEGA domain-containing protein [Pyrinomonadaceae bacterium]|nr:PEGA domain-containing protein [Pyrinomonadaceae bacterium]MCX7639288.1 PEGA domain-containing protein [Pyrinomonadaceae bacterium]MDW8303490.1 PEGA domain-containing protein [Acidobacteriota bacterium]
MRATCVCAFLLLFFSFGLSLANDEKKPPKNTGILSIKTSPESYPVVVDGVVIGMSGVDTPAEFYLSPGTHKLEIRGPNGQTYVKQIEIRKGVRNCICVKVVEKVTKRPCPYDVWVEAPDKIKEGDLVTFVAMNRVQNTEIPLSYRWRVFPEGAKIISGLGTSSITVDSTGLGGKTIIAELDVSDDVYGNTCFQKNRVNTEVEKLSIPEPKSYNFDEFVSRSFDDDKARLDNFVIELQNKPESQGYIIIYQGTDKISRTRNKADVLAKRTLDYLTKVRGIDPRRIVITQSELTKEKTTYQLWVIPPGGKPPVLR